jgi:hypothetical protein
MTGRHAVSIKTTYWIPNQELTEHIFDTPREARMGLTPHSTPNKPPAGSFIYSGMHDQGILDAPREGGDMAILIACCEDAKAHTDHYLTNVIMQQTETYTSEQQAKAQAQSQLEDQHTKKKTKIKKNSTDYL